MTMNPINRIRLKKKITNQNIYPSPCGVAKTRSWRCSILRPYFFKNWLEKNDPVQIPGSVAAVAPPTPPLGERWRINGPFRAVVTGHKSYRHTHYGSMGLVYTPTWMVDFYGKCRWIYHTWILWDTITVVGGTVDTCMRYSTSWVLAGLLIATLKLQSAELIKRSQW